MGLESSHVTSIETLIGTYEGSGTWHDAAGASAAYTITQTNVVTNLGFDVTFRHDFEDGSVVEARFNMIWIAASIFRVEAAGSPLGHGYVFDSYCHYHLKVGEAFVEASYRGSGNDLEVHGSSTRNANGNYIAWKETLRRTSA